MSRDADQIIAEAKQLIDTKRAQQAIALLKADDLGTSQNPEAAYLLGVAHFRTKAFEESEQAFRHAVSLTPDNHLAVYYLGLTLERQGQRDAAIRAFSASVKLEPGFVDGHRKLADLGVASEPMTETAEPSRSAPMTQFMLPDGPEELDTYIDRKVKRRRAEYSLEWRATPLPVKIIQLIFLVLVLAFIGAVFIYLGLQILQDA